MAYPDLPLNRLCLLFFLLAMALGSSCVRAASNSNPADELADLINNNRTASNLPRLADNPGLACIALQYVHDFQQQCDAVGKERPPATLINTTFADNCGVEGTTVKQPLTGQVVYCGGSYMGATEAWAKLMGSSNKTSAVVGDVKSQEMGVAVGSYGGGSPFYWAALFSDGSPNTTFVFSSGKPLVQHDGCFSGTGQPCSASSKLPLHRHGSFLLLLLLAIAISTPLLTSL